MESRHQEWTPDSVREVAKALYGPTWQTRLAEAIADATGMPFQAVRVRHWYLDKNGRPIPAWLQEKLSEIFMAALVEYDRAREVVIRELRLRRGTTNWPDDFRGI